ncbi:MAG: thioredoxin family protein [Bacteroidota bacterium]|nr:thioredoxin family protein [Bacteroidota bacterium]
MKNLLLFFLLIFLPAYLFSQDTAFRWTVTSNRIADKQYELIFSTMGNSKWQLYSPNQKLSDLATTEVQFTDSSITSGSSFAVSGSEKKEQSALFNTQVVFFEGPTTWRQKIDINGAVPASLQGTLLYTYGKGDEFYPSTPIAFTVSLEGGVQATTQIKISSVDINKPVSACGDDDATRQGVGKIFLIGLGAGILSLLFPCIFPLIPLTVSFFTKRSQSKKQAVVNAFWYGFFIALIFVLLSLPFHLLNVQPEILNNISTNVPLNLIFFTIFIVFAISFFGYFEIVLPGSVAGKADSRAGMKDLIGIFFMALTLVIVSFSCTGPILGSLLVGALTSENGAWQLTSGMAGFGIGLGAPFVLFALFPNWLQSLPKSGSWMNELKAVFGFIELAMAVKFLSNADLVKQWHILPREIFIGLWAVIGFAIVFYLAGIIRFPHDSKTKMTPLRIGFIILFAAISIYLIPGVTNTKSANLSLISGFPPPVCYSVYKQPVNCIEGVEALKDYSEAIKLAKQQNKPVLIDFTGWACVNCRRMEENVWPDEEVKSLMKNDFILVSLYVDERKQLPTTEQIQYTTKNGEKKSIVTVGDKWATFQSENFNAVAQPQYAIISPNEIALTKTKGYTRSAKEFAAWLRCGLETYKKISDKK